MEIRPDAAYSSRLGKSAWATCFCLDSYSLESTWVTAAQQWNADTLVSN